MKQIFLFFLSALFLCFAKESSGGEAKKKEVEKSEKNRTPDPYRGELVPLPIVAASSDIGFAFGAFVAYSKMNPLYKPFKWQLKGQFLMSLKKGDNGYELPTHDHFLKLDFPAMEGRRLRIYLKGGFKKNIITGWYGPGNGTLSDKGGIHRRFMYKMQTPVFDLVARWKLAGAISFFAAIRYQYSILDVYKNSLLEEDIEASKDGSGYKLYGYDNSGLLQFQGGLLWDTRDDEVNPEKGSLYEISLRGAPGALTKGDFNYGGVNIASRNFISLYGEYLVAALHLSGDMMFGNVPFYELSKVTGLEVVNAVGSEKGVRGVPAQRYSGKIKMFGSFELRALFYRFNIKSERFGLGWTLFFDAGRVWADWKKDSSLDGEGAGLKIGAGGGPRILWGDAVVIRADVAYSKDASPVGFYVEATRAF